ncbi:MAG TPA: nucleotidyltransferase domain-containing protein [Candidatus Dormibacteraeota bacterium]|nr:nucleotidyltransferase domain-containing protein [Candidatus Dormibacteraeota bacterium]
MEKDLAELVDGLKLAAGANLKAVVLYGSAATGEFQPRHSDLNILCVLERLDGAELQKLTHTSRWWEKKGHPAPLVFDRDELHRSADVFAIEFLDIQRSNRVLFGENIFANFDVPLDLHRQQIERELRTNVLRLRQSYLTAAKNEKALHRLLTESISSFIVLFRHALLAEGAPVPQSRRAVVESLAAKLGFDAVGVLQVLGLREAVREPSYAELERVFHAYLGAVTHVVEEIDRRFDQLQ